MELEAGEEVVDHRWVRRALWAWPLVVPWTWFLVRDLGPVFDALALAIPLLVLVAVVVQALVAYIRRRVRGAAVAASWALFGGVAVAGPWVPHTGPAPVSPLRLVEVNVKGGTDAPGLMAAIERQHPDIVVVSETGGALRPALAARFKWSLPPERKDVTVFADRPLRLLSAPAALGARAMRIEVQGPAGPFVLYALHLVKPGLRPAGSYQVTFGRHRQIVAALAHAARAERLPVVIAGDLNLSDRTWGYRNLAHHFRDAGLAGWGGPTSERGALRRLQLRIDHVFVSSGWCAAHARRMALPGSDHRGVATTIGPCPTVRR